jgi:hypothetical protein
MPFKLALWEFASDSITAHNFLHIEELYTKKFYLSSNRWQALSGNKLNGFGITPMSFLRAIVHQ